MSEPYRGQRCGRSTAFPNLWAWQSHPRVDELDSATTTTRHFDNRASWFSLDSTSASYQEALPLCTRHAQLTRTRSAFEPDRPHERIENRQSDPGMGAGVSGDCSADCEVFVLRIGYRLTVRSLHDFVAGRFPGDPPEGLGCGVEVL